MYMSMMNLGDVTGSFLLGQLQQYFRAHVIGLGCAALIIFAFIGILFGFWYEKRRITFTLVTTEEAKVTSQRLVDAFVH